MTCRRSLVVLLSIALQVLTHVAATDDGEQLVAEWRLDEVDRDVRKSDVKSTVSHSIREQVSGATSDLVGFHKLVRGVAGSALRLGGINSYAVQDSGQAPNLSPPFSIECWAAFGAYPFHWCPVVTQADEERGYFFGIDAYGHLAFKAAVDGKWQEIVSPERINLGKWTHIACSFDADGRMKLYLNGKPVSEKLANGQFEPATSQDLWIGREAIKRKPLGTIRKHGSDEIFTYFDGILDELRIRSRAFDDSEVARRYSESVPADPPELPVRNLPAGPVEPGPFGAFYATLNYYDAWDAQWRVGGRADVVVRFSDNPCRFVFWRGTNYIPNWVSENGIWFNNQFNETWSERGCHEPMSDKQCRYSQVRIVESSDARVVVHWRYALVDNWYNFAHVDPVTGLGDWSDELYTIYPDGVGVRKITLHSTVPMARHEWQESIVVMGPGQRPTEVLQPDAVTLANPSGESRSYSWDPDTPKNPTLPRGANIELINTKSQFKPFIAVSPTSNPSFDICSNRRHDPVIGIFPWWNHWPTSFEPSDGRYAMDSDRASHSSLTHCNWDHCERTENSMTKVMLHGMSNKSVDQIVRIANSWTAPPSITIEGTDFVDAVYDLAQRAYVVRRASNNNDGVLRAHVNASPTSPVANLALCIKNWGDRDAKIMVDGKPARSRTSRHTELESNELIVWVEHESTSPISIVIEPKQ